MQTNKCDLEYNNLLSRLKTISLDDLDKVKLLDRKDTKFVFNQNKLPLILGMIQNHYSVLEIENCQIFNYENIYYDTDDFLFYKQHHNEQRKRYKVRFRKYSNSNKSFFEIKIKNNKNRTKKERMLVKEMSTKLESDQKFFLKEVTGIKSAQLVPSLDIQFSRITLVDNNFSERLTIDNNLFIKNKYSSKAFDKLTILEIKQPKYNPKSQFIHVLRSLNIHEMRFSKYCLGLIHVNQSLKYNRFKTKLLQLNKILA